MQCIREQDVRYCVLLPTAQVTEIYQEKLWPSDLLHWTIDFRANNWVSRTFQLVLHNFLGGRGSGREMTSGDSVTVAPFLWRIFATETGEWLTSLGQFIVIQHFNCYSWRFVILIGSPFCSHLSFDYIFHQRFNFWLTSSPFDFPWLALLLTDRIDLFCCNCWGIC